MRKIKVLKKILSANDRAARELRGIFSEKNVFALNLMSSPGSGKTSLLEKTIPSLMPSIRSGIIEGDITTSVDARRLSFFDAPVVSINTMPFGGQCHLEAAWIYEAFEQMNSNDFEILFIENIGNLVCPAEFDTGSHKNAVIISVTEGEDKPLKYPLAFRESDIMVINKCDLIDVLDFDLPALIKNARKINPGIEFLTVSARSGEGIDKWVGWLRKEYDILSGGGND
ncbi:MAG: hydrogenase nickel incorporation protein HypB [Elusimicrobiota bacterium]